ncbi:type II CRISPR RNA-guided endonuclease Cas9 [Lacunimicrobium album]
MKQTTLGIDLGVSSLGWALIEHNKNMTSVSIVDAGVRIFDPGVEGTAAEIEQGRDTSKAATRRGARQIRRQAWRRQRRKSKLFRILQQHDLLPAGDGHKSVERDATLKTLDAQLIEKYCPKSDVKDHITPQVWLYQLRAKAVEQPLTRHEFGRVLYLLAQRRGFYANSKSTLEDGVVNSSIEKLNASMGAKTLGQYYAQRNPHERQIRGRLTNVDDPHAPEKDRVKLAYTARKQHEDEFDRIWSTQAQHQDGLDEALKKEIRRALFHQRRLKSQKNRIGYCSLIPTKRRCVKAHLVFQEFRIWQGVNHLVYVTPGQGTRKLSPDEKQRLVAELAHGDLTYKDAKALLGIKGKGNFSIENAGDEDDAPKNKILGNRTSEKLRTLFGDRWAEFSPDQQEEIIYDQLNFQNRERLQVRMKKKFGLSHEQAEKFTRLKLEDDYAQHSKVAMERLLVEMRIGTEYATARLKIFPASFQPTPRHERLPKVDTREIHFLRDLANPAVRRALTELRKVVNAILEKHHALFIRGKDADEPHYGKPDFIHVELARDLKNSKKKRQDQQKVNNENQKRREKAKLEVVKQLKVDNPERYLEKWLLADECNWECPYTGLTISASTLDEFDIEHIYPRRFLDNSFGNKTLCSAAFNRKFKRNRFPSEVLHGDEYNLMIERVSRFKGPENLVKKKLARFQTMPDEILLDDFLAERYLNETRYNSRLAAQFVGLLYGGRTSYDDEGKPTQRVYTPSGALTGHLRRAMGVNRVLSLEEDNEKNRGDHRHHAVDAVMVSMLDQGVIKSIADFAEEDIQTTPTHRMWSQVGGGLNKRFPDLIEQLQDMCNEIIISHRPTRTLGGPLHAESIYSQPITDADGNQVIRIRKSLDKLTVKEIESDAIVDPLARAAVQDQFAKLKAAGKKLPSQAFADVANHPRLPSGVAVHKVRVNVSAKPRTIGNGPSQRQVASGQNSNFAALVYAVLDEKGEVVQWKHEVISRLDAHQRMAANKHLPKGTEKILIPKQFEQEIDPKAKKNRGLRFLFAIKKNDMLEVLDEGDHRSIYRVQKLSEGEIQLCPHVIPTIANDQRTKWNQIQSTDNLRKRMSRKVQISVLGEIRVNSSENN